MAYQSQADPVLVFANQRHLYFGIHGATDPVYEGTGWFDPYDRDTTGRPAWRGDVVRCAWSGGLALPDADGARAGWWTRVLRALGLRTRPAVPSPVEINARQLPWLRSSDQVGIHLHGGMPLSEAARCLALVGAELYVPLVTTGAVTWARWDEVRRDCRRAANIVDGNANPREPT
jgi:hypothetical protein